MFRIIFAVCLLVSSAAAQTATGVITGSVLDSTGASVAGAKVSLVIRKRTKRASRRRTLPAYTNFAPRRIYNIQVEMAGFKKEEIRNLQLTVAQTLQLDIKLELGQVTDSVTVEATAGQIQSARRAFRK